MKTHWIEFFRIVCIATSKEHAYSSGVGGRIVGDFIMLALPEGEDDECTRDAIGWLQERENMA